MSIQERRKEMLLLVEQWHESGQTQKDFARDHGITKSKMGYWVRKAQQLYNRMFSQNRNYRVNDFL